MQHQITNVEHIGGDHENLKPCKKQSDENFQVICHQTSQIAALPCCLSPPPPSSDQHANTIHLRLTSKATNTGWQGGTAPSFHFIETAASQLATGRCCSGTSLPSASQLLVFVLFALSPSSSRSVGSSARITTLLYRRRSVYPVSEWVWIMMSKRRRSINIDRSVVSCYSPRSLGDTQQDVGFRVTKPAVSNSICELGEIEIKHCDELWRQPHMDNR